jgi:hypothetical protein
MAVFNSYVSHYQRVKHGSLKAETNAFLETNADGCCSQSVRRRFQPRDAVVVFRKVTKTQVWRTDESITTTIIHFSASLIILNKYYQPSLSTKKV